MTTWSFGNMAMQRIQELSTSVQDIIFQQQLVFPNFLAKQNFSENPAQFIIMSLYQLHTGAPYFIYGKEDYSIASVVSVSFPDTCCDIGICSLCDKLPAFLDFEALYLLADYILRCISRFHPYSFHLTFNSSTYISPYFFSVVTNSPNIISPYII